MDDGKENKEAESGENKRGISFKLIVVLLLVIAIGGGGGYFAYMKFLSQKNEDTAQEKPAEADTAKDRDDEVGPIYHMDPYIVNLADSEGMRYLKATLELELSDDKLRLEVERKLPLLRDAALLLLSSKTFDEISDTGGKMRLREDLEKKLDGLINSGRIRKVYFTEFVVQ
jgi:flagellar FliL protein